MTTRDVPRVGRSDDDATTAPAAAPPAGVVAPSVGRDPEGHLATGWEPHRPLSDGLVRSFVFAYASSFTGPVQLLGGRVVQRDEHVVWDLGRPSGFYNGAMLLRALPYVGWEEHVTQLEADLLESGSGEVMLFSPWPTPDLSGRGWQLAGHPPLLMRERGEPEPPLPPWIEVRRVEDAATLADWEHVAVEGYPLDDLRPVRTGALVDARVLSDPSFHAWVGYRDGTPITIGTSYVIHGVHVFALGVTLPAHRGRGAWEVMARRRLSSFTDLPAMALFSDHSRSPAQRLGFRALARWTVWTRKRPTRTS